MTDTPAQIAVIVINYGTAALAIYAVDSVLTRAHGGRAVAVHLVDNASPGGDGAALAEALEARGWAARGVRLWAEAENHGFGRGNNVVLNALAAQDTPPEYVLLLNPDASLHNEAIDHLARALEAHPDTAAAGAAVLRPDLSPARAAFRFPGARSELARITGLGLLDRLWAARQVALPADQPEGPVDWVSGAAVMFRFSALRETGFFDPGFFLYYEEVDLMRRLRAAGWQVRFTPQAQVLHAEGAATGQFASAKARQRDPWYLYQSWAHYFARARGRGGALALALALWPAALVNILHRRLRGKAPGVPERFFRDHWTHVIRPLLRGRTGSPPKTG